VLALPLLAAACSSGDDAASTTASTNAATTDASPSVATTDDEAALSPSEPTPHEPVKAPRIEPSPPDVTVSGLSIADGGSLDGAPAPLVDLAEIRSGGPPPDGIPSIDEPAFITAAEVDFLAENEPVLALDIDGDVRAYPVQILMWHEIVNDTVGGIPIAVTYCPLCNSALAYDRRIASRVLEFGTSGLRGTRRW
jgi:hypothetical protein